MADRSLVSKDLVIRGLDDDGIRHMLDVLGGRGARWMIGSIDGKLQAVWPPDGSVEPVDDPAEFCKARSSIGVLFPDDQVDAFCQRFPDATDHVQILRIAGLVAPVLTDLHSGLTGIHYDLQPAPRTRQIINLFGRFLPKDKAVALRLNPESGDPVCLYVRFDGNRRISELVGGQAWPGNVQQGGSLKKLGSLGAPVDVGITGTPAAVRGLFEERLNRQGWAALFKSGDLQLDPCPMPIKVALKAARIL